MSFPSSPDAVAALPPRNLAIHLDLVGGLAGDMFVAALVDALPYLAEPVLAALAAVRPEGENALRFDPATSGGMRARRFGQARAEGVHARGESTASAAAEPSVGPHAHGTEAADAQASGTSYVQLRQQLEAAPLPAATREHAMALLDLLAEAEAHVHGVPLDAVHFHELADWDSLADLVAAGSIAAQLEGASWGASSVPLGGGMVRTAHGRLPVPTPATSRLLVGYPWHDDGVAGERVTPTGAAILRHLVPATACGARRAAGRLVAVGNGAGTRSLPGLPNVARALVFERMEVVGPGAGATDTVTLVEFDIDDMTGEEIAHAAERLRVVTGVVDVSIGSRVGKKGRPLAEFRVLARPEAADAVVRACFTETSTLGVRLREERRRVLARDEVIHDARGAPMRVKIAERPGGERSAKSAHDDVAETAGLASRRALRAASERAALKEEDE